MKEVLLLRHAKSDWDHPGLSDFERPLAKRGVNDAPIIGKFLDKANCKPDFIICSPAQRALETIKKVMKAAHIDEDLVHWDDSLYYGTAGDYLKAIASAPKEAERVLLVGHNPLIESAAELLITGEQRSILRMPTGALVCMEGHVSHWDQLLKANFQLKWMSIPKVLKEFIS